MSLRFTPYAATLIALGVIALTVAWYAWRRRTIPGALPLSALGMSMSVWLFSYALELSSLDLPVALFWVRIEYLGIVSVPVIWVWFAVEYSGAASWLDRRRIALLVLVPLVTVAIIWTNDVHWLFWRSVTLETDGPFTFFNSTYGAWFWVHAAYSYLCLLGGAYLLVQFLVRSSRLFRGQAGMLLIAVAAPWLGNALYLSGLSPWDRLDLTPFAFAITLMTIGWSMLHFSLFRIIPVARDMALQSMRDGVMVLDDRGVVVDVNRAAQGLIGRPGNRIIGRPAGDVLAPWADTIRRYRDITELTDEIGIGEGPEQRWYDVRISPIYDERRVFRGRLIVWRDISEQHRAREELRRNNEQLLAAQQALVEARDIAEAGSRARSAFLAHVSHELRTPLTSILGYCQLLQIGLDRQSYDETRADLDAIRSSASHLLELIDNVLHITIIEAGRTDLHVVSFAVEEIIHDVACVVQPLVVRNRNTLRIECDPAIGMMCADPAKVRQILLHVLGNAVKFTNDGIVTLVVTRETIDNRQWMLFRVTDTGPGIPAERVPHLFTPFAIANDPIVRGNKGAGLGLAISHHYCQLMGGDITVASVNGKGTTFVVRLPVHTPMATPVAG